jgi:GntR family transcriptional repressor for pyruvate dehydrogenase complex
MDTEIRSGPTDGRRLSQHLTEDLLDRIARGEFAAGDRLPTAEALSAEYGVARSTVREAIGRLAALGLLDIRPRRGATILATSASRAFTDSSITRMLGSHATDDLYEMRLLLESHAAALAASRALRSDLDQARGHHRAYKVAMDAGEVPWREDLAFHTALVAASHNSVLARMLNASHDLLAVDRERSGRSIDLSAFQRSYRAHDAVLQAVEAKDSQLAKELMADHIQVARGYATRAVGNIDSDEVEEDDEGARDDEH